MRFKPYLGLTIVTALALAILIALGTWQMQRLSWKTQLLIDIEAASQSVPFDTIAQVEAAIASGQPIDYRRVVLSGRYVPAANWLGELHVFRVQNKATGWRIYRALEQGDALVYVAGEWVPDSLKEAQRVLPAKEQGVVGYIRAYEKPSRFAATSTPDQNRWFSFNAVPDQYDWADAVERRSAITQFYIDSVYQGSEPFIGELPVRVPEVPNNHFDYMLTWYSFALILLVIYILLHIRGNRLTFRG